MQSSLGRSPQRKNLPFQPSYQGQTSINYSPNTQRMIKLPDIEKQSPAKVQLNQIERISLLGQSSLSNKIQIPYIPQKSTSEKRNNLQAQNESSSERVITSQTSRHSKILKFNNFFNDKDAKGKFFENQSQSKNIDKIKYKQQDSIKDGSVDVESSTNLTNITTSVSLNSQQNSPIKASPQNQKYVPSEGNQSLQKEYYYQNQKQLSSQSSSQQILRKIPLQVSSLQKSNDKIVDEEQQQQIKNGNGSINLGQFVSNINRGEDLIAEINKKQSQEKTTFKQQNQLQHLQKLLSPPEQIAGINQKSKNETKSLKLSDKFLRDNSIKQKDNSNSKLQNSSFNNSLRKSTTANSLKNSSNLSSRFSKKSDEKDISPLNSNANEEFNLNKNINQENNNKNSQSKKITYYNYQMTKALKQKIPLVKDTYFINIFKDHFIQTFHSLQFCKAVKIPNHIINLKKIYLEIHPHNTGKKTIVFDLDETLIHCNENTSIPSDVIVPIVFPTNDVINAGINIRPYAKECLQELSKYFEIIIFTASHECYATKVIDLLDPENKYVSHRLSRNHCVQTEEGVHIKDLSIFGNRNIKDIVLVDNAAYSFGMQVNNGIPIIPFYDNKKDSELQQLTNYLINNILNSNDVREENNSYFKMHLHQQTDKMEQAAKKIYNL